MVLVSNFRKKRRKGGRKVLVLQMRTGIRGEKTRGKWGHRCILHFSRFCCFNKTVPVCREMADAGPAQCSTVLVLLQGQGAAPRPCQNPGLTTRSRTEARVVLKPLTPPEVQPGSGIGALFVQTCPQSTHPSWKRRRSDHKGNSPPAMHLFLSQTRGSLSLNLGRPMASIV